MQSTTSRTPLLNFLQGGKKIHIPAGDIIRLEACSNYTRIYFSEHPPVLMAKVLRNYDRLLKPYGFVRTHRSHLVNPNFVVALDHDGILQMEDTSVVEVSRRKKREISRAFSKQYFQTSKRFMA